MCGPGCKMFLLNPGVFASRDTSSEGGPIPCHVGNPISNKRHGVFDFIIYVEREMQAFCYLVIYLM